MHYEKFPDGSVKCIEDEIPFELPQGWECERLSNMASFSSGKTPSTSKDEYWGDDYLWITSKDMKSKYIDSSQTSLSEKGAKIMQIKAPDTLLLVARSGILRHTLPVAILKKRATINQDIKAISLYDTSLAEFIYSFLKGTENHILLKYIKSGTTVENINFDEFKNIIIPVPPKSEQILINEKINTLLSFIETIESDKTDLQATIQLTKSKILDLAIRGKLVPQNPDDEPASVLLDRIRAEKEELIKQGKIKRDKKESVIFRGEDNSYYEVIASKTTNIDDDLPFELPDGWEWCRLGSIMDICSSKRVLQSEWKKEGVPFYRAREIVKLSETGRVDNDLFISEEHYQNLKKDYGIPKSGDLMVSGVGTIGKVYIVCENDKFYYKDASVLCFQNTYNALYPLYAKLLIDSSFVQKQMSDNSKGTTVDTITISTATTYLCILPPINEQKRIADKVSQLFSLLDSIAENIN